MAEKYEVWTTKDGRKVPVREMSDLHLLHTIRAIKEGRVFTERLEERDAWMAAFTAEAERRSLDTTRPPSRRLGLIDWLISRVADGLGMSDFRADGYDTVLLAQLEAAGVPQPEIDVSELDGSVTYLHWKTDGGTPLTR